MAGEQPGSYEAARDELAAIVARLESGQIPLAESLALWERGEELAELCRRYLDGVHERLAALDAATDDADVDGPMAEDADDDEDEV